VSKQYTPEDLRAVADAAERIIAVLVDAPENSIDYTEVGSHVIKVEAYVPGYETTFTLTDQGDAWYAIELGD
jgi:hypothetical protein